MREPKIHFVNEPFRARVFWREGDELIECIPVVYDAWNLCGIAIFSEDGIRYAWGLLIPRDLITSWRATVIIRYLDEIEVDTLCKVYYAGRRRVSPEERRNYVEPIIAMIGKDTYEEIMAMPVPEKIIRAILDNQSDPFPPSIFPITEEVRAGTIDWQEWKEEFTELGIKHPDEIDAQKRREKKILSKFETLLSSYAEHQRIRPGTLGMDFFTNAFMNLVKKGVHQKYPDEVVVALAGVIGELTISEFVLSIWPFGQDEELITEKKKEAIEEAAKWLVSEKPSLFRFWNYRKYQKLLYKLLSEYFE